ncbi:Fucokinase domain-containing protein [Trichostrongylus colubriformis]|uniref:Fucokinase domain-containing protein n=1 Tax=Trichostrongylus colubriformis TaxID=6319 RepID=A0AAN8IIV2_TRICO
MWDLLVLTAGNERQKCNFELLLAEVDTTPYCRRTMVISDHPVDVKIGSGGATLNVLRSIEDQAKGQKVLLIHSGGLSQRLPHISAFGKIFLTLPNSMTVLEAKLRSYKHLPHILPPGLLVAASDVLEDVSAFEKCNSTSDMVLFATESSLKKPSLDEMKAAGAILPSGNALTDW